MGGGERFQAIAANNPKRSFSIRFSVQRVKLFARSVGKRLHQPCRHGLECANCSTAYVVQSSHRDPISRHSCTKTSENKRAKTKHNGRRIVWPKARPLLTHVKNGSGSREFDQTTSPDRSQHETHRAAYQPLTAAQTFAEYLQDSHWTAPPTP